MIPEHANQEGTFHSIARINVYNDGIKEGREGFFILISHEQSPKVTTKTSIDRDTIAVVLEDGGNSLVSNGLTHSHSLVCYCLFISCSFSHSFCHPILSSICSFSFIQ